MRQIVDRRIQHRLGRQRRRVIKRLRRAREVREADERQIAMRLEQAHQVRLTHEKDLIVCRRVGGDLNDWDFVARVVLWGFAPMSGVLLLTKHHARTRNVSRCGGVPHSVSHRTGGGATRTLMGFWRLLQVVILVLIWPNHVTTHHAKCPLNSHMAASTASLTPPLR